MAGNEVGKVGLGIEFVGDIGKQVASMAQEMGQRLAKSFGATLKGMDFSNALKEAIKGAADIDSAMKSTTDSIKEAEKSLDNMKSKLKDVIIPQIPASVVSSPSATASSVSPPVPASVVTPASVPAAPVVSATYPSKPSKSKSKKVVGADVETTEAEIRRLTAVLENTNEKIRAQEAIIANLKTEYANFGASSQRELEGLNAQYEATVARAEALRAKLKDLKQSLEAAVTPEREFKLREEIAKTESTIASLGAKADGLLAKIEKLESDTGRSALQKKILDAEAQLLKLNQQAEKTTNKINELRDSTNKTDKTLQKTNKTLGITGKAFAAAAKGANNMGNQFTAAFKRIAKQVLIFSVIYRAIRGLQQYISSSLRTNEEYAKSLATVRMNLKSAFAPIFQAVLPAINALVRAMVTATTYVAAFTSALFGKTYKQSLQAAIGLDKARAAMDKTAKSANKLAGFDELNLLDTSDGGDDGGLMSDIQAFEMPELDIDSIQTQMDALALGIRTTFEQAFGFIQSSWQAMTVTFGPSIQSAWAVIQPELLKWKEQFGAMFSGILMLGEPLKNWWQNDLMPLWNQSIIGLSSIFAGLSESVRMAFNSVWEAAFPIFEKFVADGLPKITEFVAGATEAFGQLFGVVKQVFDDIWGEAIDPVLQLISDVIRDTLDVIFEWWDTWGQDIVDRIKVSLEKIKELWDNLWNKMLKPIITKMLDKMKELWDNHLKDLVKEIGNFIGKLITAAQDIYNKFIAPIINWLVKILGPVVSEIFDGVIDVIGNALGSIADAAKGIIRALGGIIDFIAGVFTGDWKRAWDGIKTFFSGIGDAIGSIFKGAINMIIDALNWMIKQVNKISFDVPDWVPVIGGKKFGFNIPQIPRLAEGGLVTGPTLAWVGDNRHANVDPEVITPLSKLQDMLSGSNQEIVDALYMIAQLLQDFARRPVILEANGTQLAKVVDTSRDDRTRRAGRTLSMA